MTRRKSRGPEQTDRAGMHKRPEDGMWLLTGGQSKTVTYAYPLSTGKSFKKERKKDLVSEIVM